MLCLNHFIESYNLPIFQMSTVNLSQRTRSQPLNSVQIALAARCSGLTWQERLLCVRGAAWRPDGERGKEPRKGTFGASLVAQ